MLVYRGTMATGTIDKCMPVSVKYALVGINSQGKTYALNEVTYPPTSEILDELDALNEQIIEETKALRALLGE